MTKRKTKLDNPCTNCEEAEAATLNPRQDEHGRVCEPCREIIKIEIAEEKEQWHLSKLELEFETYGEAKGTYSGRISFQNGHRESFNFRIRPDMAQDYIDLIAEDIVKGAENLGQRLLQSLGLDKTNEI